MAYANFISDLLSVVFAEYTQLICFFEMDDLIKVTVQYDRPQWCSGLGAGHIAGMYEYHKERFFNFFLLGTVCAKNRKARK